MWRWALSTCCCAAPDSTWPSSELSSAWFFFFFQAEDGIRDLTVTGVQTCALPIFPNQPVGEQTNWRIGIVYDEHETLRFGRRGGNMQRWVCIAAVAAEFCRNLEIGRASCRERV